MGKLKFGDKVQLVALGVDAYRSNVLNGREPLRWGGNVHMGDVGVIVREATVHDRPKVVFSTDTQTMIVRDEEIMLESETSNIIALENIIKLQETVKISSKNYPSLHRTVIYNESKMQVGCQSISKVDALQIAADITAHFGK